MSSPESTPISPPDRPTLHQHQSLVNVLGVVYLHTPTEDGGDLYLTRFAEGHRDQL